MLIGGGACDYDGGDGLLRGGGGKLGLVQRDEVLGLAARAVDRLIEMLSRAFERRDDIARIEASGGGLETRHDAARRGPAFGGVAELGPSSALVLFALGAAHAEIVGEDADLLMHHVFPGSPDVSIDAVRLAPSHCLGTGIVAIATPADAGLGPMPTDVAGHAPVARADLPAPPPPAPRAP